ncbi:MAG: hypoxanthine phosphoribosyltransferase [Lactobacillaceae bacterium]|jgi:hypoxanthine phosphoribosyltransferase|nr:hypoxanthine phosphoribosyltransferase [Lactobacillaceae bacterium]
MEKMSLERVVLTEDQITDMVQRVAAEINAATSDDDTVFVGIMKGAYIWMADLMRAMNRNVELDYIDVSSYSGASSTGVVTIERDLKIDITNKTVVVLDEVVDTGLTLSFIKQEFIKRGAKRVLLAVATDKRTTVGPDDIQIDFTGAQVPDEFLVGYGMDYNNNYRNLSHVAVLKLEQD